MIGGVAFGRFFGLYFPVPGMWAVIGFVCFPGLWGFAWLFCWLCPYAGVGCGVFFFFFFG